MRKVLSIQSHVVHGYVGNKAATFPMQLLGFDVDIMNTTQLSNHTQYDTFTGNKTAPATISDLFRGIIANGFAHEYSYILTGYVGNPELLIAIADNLMELKKLEPSIKFLIDPVLGDNGRLYCPAELVYLYRERLLKPLADIITPNGYEAELLTDIKPSSGNINLVLDRLHDLGPSVVIITSVVEGESCVLYGSSKLEQKRFKIVMPLYKEVLTGTGDTFAALLLCHLDKLPIDEACVKAVDSMQAIIANTLSLKTTRNELALIQSANVILNPPAKHKSTDL